MGLALCMNARRTGRVGMRVQVIADQIRLPGSRRMVQRALRALEEDWHAIEFLDETTAGGTRKYRILVGWPDAGGRAAEVAPAPPTTREEILLSAYADARQRRHGVAHVPQTQSWVVAAAVAMLGAVSTDTGVSFADTAARAMRAFMSLDGLDDRKLITALHPLDWITPYISTIEQELRTAHRRTQERRAQAAGADHLAVDETEIASPQQHAQRAAELVAALRARPLKKVAGE